MAQPSSAKVNLADYADKLYDLDLKIQNNTATKEDKSRYALLARKANLELEKQKAPAYNTTLEAIRSAAGGLLFNFADELEAGIRAGGFSNPQYKKLVTELRAKKNNFEKENPKLALATSLAGSLVVPGGIAVAGAKTAGKGLVSKAAQALSKPTVTRQTMVGAGYGALGGAGVAEQPEDLTTEVTAGVLAGGIGSGALSLAGNALAPTIQKGAKLLQKEGVTLTPGQAVGGVAQFLEERLVPATFGESTFLARRLENMQKFNLAAANRAFRDVGQRIPDDATPEDLLVSGQKIVNDMYDKVYTNLKINMKPRTYERFSSRSFDLLKKENFDKKLSKDFLERKEILIDELEAAQQGAQTYGQARKRFRENVIDPLNRQNKGTQEDIKLMGGLQELLEISDDIIGSQQTNRNVIQELNNANKSFAKWSRITDAMGRNKAGQNVFSPDDLIAVVRKAKGKGKELEEFALQAKPVMSGSGMRSSGTGERLAQTELTKNILKAGPVAGGALTYGTGGALAAAVAPSALYSSVAQKAFNKLIDPSKSRDVLGTLLKRSAAPAGALYSDASLGAPDSVAGRLFGDNPLVRTMRNVLL
jgi:hypothetical protein